MDEIMKITTNHLSESAESRVTDWINKSFLTNLVALAVFVSGYLSPIAGEALKSIGAFALSGAITNWLAVYMLFERIPGLYGSGIIPNRFKEFKGAIKELIMGQFFTKDQVAKFMANPTTLLGRSTDCMDFSSLLDRVDYDKVFAKLLEAVNASPMGMMLQMMGGASALDPIRKPFEEKMREALNEFLSGDEMRQAVEPLIVKNIDHERIVGQVEEIVEARLSELTPLMVKEIIQNMIREHLGWLVIWGGVFGGLLGFLSYVLK